MKYIIYKHTLIVNCKHKGWSYIGQTCRAEDPNLRWCNGKGYTKCRKFYNAIKKYGWDAFSHKVLAEVNTPEEADRLEINYIKKYDSINNGYNITLGGAGRHAYKPILQMDLNKNIIARFNSISEAELELGLPFRHSNINACCNGKLRKSHGYCWCYEQDYKNYKIKPKIKVLTRNTKEIYQLDSNKTILNKFSSALFAYKTISGKANAKHGAQVITACCKKERLSAYGYWWCYVPDYETFNPIIPLYKHKVAQLDPKTYKILTIYNDLKTAAKAVGINGYIIGQVCRNKRKTAVGYAWKYLD